ncbi:MAG TPA: UDP-4-amino-4,6-dideoxy-N-acetyl-beta-L-altrosamine transaminase [Salinarimonas sp.]|nr:UDP-4-amino-4,6-dideoxy-N-acetyl-beta-L-altrosamine transaminase [Salinarimonas sp.]
MIPYGRQDIQPEDVEAVAEVLRSDFLTQGPAVPRFEAALATYAGARHAVAVNSATSALHVAYMALGLGPGDLLWTSPNTFVATANAALYCGADVDFVDIDPRTYNLCPEALARKLEAAERAGRLPKIVAPVHFAGEPCAMEAIAALGRRHGFRIVEDASHAVGSRVAGTMIGACAFSDVTVYSFHPVKIVTSGEGGAALTNDPELAWRMAVLQTHGVVRDPARMEGPPEGPWSYHQIALGYNYRLTDIHAALGLSQLSRIEPYLRRRNELADRYDALLAELPVARPVRDPANRSALHLYPVRLTGAAAGRRREVFERMRAAGIGVNVHYIPVHLQPFYRARGFREGQFPQAEAYYAAALTLPLFPRLEEADQDRVVGALADALRGA